MTYSYQIQDASTILLIQEFGEGKDNQENTKEITLKDFFEAAQRLGFFPEGHDFLDTMCDITFDFYGKSITKNRSYQSMLEADCFGTEDLKKIIMSFFETFPKKLFWVKTNAVEVLYLVPRRDCDAENWRLYKTTKGITQHIEKGFIDTEWSEYQTNRKTALEMLLKQLQGQIAVVKNQLESL